MITSIKVQNLFRRQRAQGFKRV